MKMTDILHYWKWLEYKPWGPWVFNRLIRFINPYTGALRSDVVVLEKGYARLQLKDRRAIRNHLNSIHAIALINLGEFTSGLALISLLTEDMRGIPIDIHTQFIKKARGVLTAECTTQLDNFTHELEHNVCAEIKDGEGDVVARVTVKWKLGYKN